MSKQIEESVNLIMGEFTKLEAFDRQIYAIPSHEKFPRQKETEKQQQNTPEVSHGKGKEQSITAAITSASESNLRTVNSARVGKPNLEVVETTDWEDLKNERN